MARARRKPAQSTKHLEVAEKLNLWASKANVGDDLIVKSLSNSLINNVDLQKWAEFDADSYLPQPKPGTQKLSLVAKRVTLLRNILVFAPVALTWAAVSEATRAFSDFTKSNPNSIANFLDFWQDGYGFLDEKWTIGAIALLDAIIVGAVIVLTVIVSIMGDRVRKGYETASREVNNLRREIVLEINLFLSEKKFVNNVVLNKNLISSIHKLLNAADHIEGSTRDLKKIIKDINNDGKVNNGRIAQKHRIPELSESLRKLLDS